ncbi:MAG: cardiolipin synthase [Clostridia bacterium]|nr:cardiolipin synthase [Clostridia bacterium]MBQ9774268.1 cardiolipin synthase [Clostridia bacterium]
MSKKKSTQKHIYKHRKRLFQFFGRRLLVILLVLFQLVFLAAMLFRAYYMYWLAAALTVLSGITAFHLLRQHDKSAFKISLIFLILFFPVFGGAFYLVFHFQTGSSGFRRRLDKLILKSREGYTPNEKVLARATAECPKDQKLLSYLQNTVAFPAYADTQTQYFPSGKEMLQVMLRDLERAERYVFLEYFIIEEGVMWDSMLEILKRKVAEGVEVRVIYDDIGSIRTLPAGYAKKLSRIGVQCRAFNPFHPFLTTIQNNRDHRKIAVIDGKIAYTGGINLADEYIDEKIRFGKWKDNSIRLCGEGAISFTTMFLQMWSLLTKTEEDVSRYLPSPAFSAVSDGWIQPYTDSPMDKENVGEHVYLHAIERTQKYLYITTPYLMVGDELMTALKYCAKAGVDVRIITPGKPDKPLVHFTTRSYYRELINAGIKVYEFAEGFMHAKTFISDGDLAIVGTVNMDYRSLYLHFECGTCLYNTSSIAPIEKDFHDSLAQCRRITEKDCKTNFFVKLLQDICRIFAPLM